MARSKYIYTVLNGMHIEAAFTVKYELENWLAKNNYLDDEEFRGCCLIFRSPDGGDGESVDITDEYFK